MSATRDRSQKIAFVYSNLYKVYREGLERARKSQPAEAPGLTTARVLKASDLAEPLFAVLRPEARPANPSVREAPPEAPAKIREYRPAELLGGRLQAQSKAVAASALPDQNAAIRSLRQNLSSLDELHSRLRFMLKELEALVKD